MAKPEDCRAVLLLAAVVVLWGANWPIMKAGLAYIPPLWFASARVLLGAGCLFLLLAWRGQLKWPHRGDWPVLASVALLQIAAFLGLVTSGLRFVEAGRSAILAYTTPLWIAPMAWLVLGERLGLTQLASIGLGRAGIIVLFNPLTFDFNDREALFGNGQLLIAAIAWAASIVHIRRHRWQSSPLALMPWQMLMGGTLLAAVAAAMEDFGSIRWSMPLVLLLAYNGPMASAFCFWAYVTVARSLPAVTLALASLAVPATGVAASAEVLGEPISTSMATGLALIAAAVAALSLPRNGP